MPSNETVSRRRLLKGLFYAVNTALAALVAVPVVGFLLGPLWRRSEGQWVEVGPVEELAAPSPVRMRLRYVSSEGYREQTLAKNVWIRSEGGASGAGGAAGEAGAASEKAAPGASEFIVFSAECTHVGCTVTWDGETERFVCPCHGGFFAADGEVLAGPPPRPLDRLPNKVEAGRLYVQV